MTDSEYFRHVFDFAFRNPRQVAPKLCTQRFTSVWVDLEPIGDWLAGPLYSIRERGECDYVFGDSENRFPGVVTRDDFLQWCLRLAEDCRKGILAHVPEGEAEHADQRLLLDMAEGMVSLSHLGHKIIEERSRRKRIVDEWEKQYLDDAHGSVPPKCPKCGFERLVRLFWKQSSAAGACKSAVDNGQAILVSIEKPSGAPRWACLACEPDWAILHALAQQVYELQLQKEQSVADYHFEVARQCLDQQLELHKQESEIVRRLMSSGT